MPYRPTGRHAVTPQGRGDRFPGFDVLDSVDVWDDVTAGAVLARLSHPTGLSFFSPAEVAVAAPLLDLLLGQDGEPRVPVLEMVDQRLALGETDGWHYDDLPEDAQAWRETLAALDEDARAQGEGGSGEGGSGEGGSGERGFGELERARQEKLLDAVRQADRWHGWPAAHVWSLWTRYACTAFYSHPWAWNEIGFPGPAYPRGYLNPGLDARERWEVADAGGRS